MVSTAALCGHVVVAGLLNAARSLPELDGVPEAGWVLGPQAWGKGIATEAMAAVMAWADARLDAAAIRCLIEPDNHGSMRVAEKLGFVPFADAELGGKPVRVLERRAQRSLGEER